MTEQSLPSVLSWFLLKKGDILGVFKSILADWAIAGYRAGANEAARVVISPLLEMLKSLQSDINYKFSNQSVCSV